MTKFRKAISIYQEEGIKALLNSIRAKLIQGDWAPITKRIIGKRLHQKLLMYHRLGYWPQIRNPRTFNEKLMHRKLYTDDPRFARVEDKWAIREFVAERVGEEILPDVYHVTDDPETIPFDSLPETYVIKPTHLSGPVIIVDEDETLNREAVIRECHVWLERTHGKAKGEYWYSDIPPQIIVEERLSGVEFDVPRDFKFYVFDGRVKYVHVDLDRYSEHKRRFYDRNWNPQEFELKFPLGPETPQPREFNKMRKVAETLGERFDFIRVDLYETAEQGVVFGELTVTPGSGGEEFQPVIYDYEFGKLWKRFIRNGAKDNKQEIE